MPHGRKTGGRKKGTPNRSSGLGIAIKQVYEDLIGSMKTGRFYVYAHYYSGQCFYVGKGTGTRAWAKDPRSDTWHEYVDAIGGCFDVRIICADLSEAEALAVEAALIRVRKPACNILGVVNDTGTQQMSLAV
jgi:hypothetical protein